MSFVAVVWACLSSIDVGVANLECEFSERDKTS